MTAALPPPRTPDPMAAEPLRWGVLGTGWIAERFTTALHRSTRQRMVAVASREADRSEVFARRVGIARAHPTYEALVADPGVDVVYVATPHHLHLRDALLAISAGKHVVVEKPLALNARQANEIATAARAAGVFCVEALWTLFLPKYDVARQVVGTGMLGHLRTGILDHGEWFPADHRILRPDLAGGSLLDLATYTVAVADDLLGPVVRVSATAELAPSGVEGQVATLATHASGALAVHHSSILTDTPVTAVIAGDKGLMVLEAPFWGPGDVRVVRHDDGVDRVWSEPKVRHEGLYWTAAEAARCIADGRTETPLRPLATSVRCLRVLDDIRAAAELPPVAGG